MGTAWQSLCMKSISNVSFVHFVLNIFVLVISVIENGQLMNGKLSISLKFCSILYVFPRENDYKVDNLFALVVLLAISNHVTCSVSVDEVP